MSNPKMRMKYAHKYVKDGEEKTSFKDFGVIFEAGEGKDFNGFALDTPFGRITGICVPYEDTRDDEGKTSSMKANAVAGARRTKTDVPF